jgi:DNA repair protein RadC
MVELVAVGILTHATIHPRETYRRAVAQGSASIIIAHNHPSGEVDPSTDDVLATRKVQEAGEVLGIPLLDHIIFSATGFYSFTRGARGGERKQ